MPTDQPTTEDESDILREILDFLADESTFYGRLFAAARHYKHGSYEGAAFCLEEAQAVLEARREATTLEADAADST